jgi:hypothetical protein
MKSQSDGLEAAAPVKSAIRYKDVQGREHVTEFGYDPEQGYWLGVREHGEWKVTRYEDEPWGKRSTYRDDLAKLGLSEQAAHDGGTLAVPARATPPGACEVTPDAVRARLRDMRAKYGAGYGDEEWFNRALLKIDQGAERHPEEAAEWLDTFLALIEEHDRGLGQRAVYDVDEDGAQALDHRDRPGGKLPTTDRRRPSTRLADRMEPIYGPRPEGHEAHHIVAEGDWRALLARKVLEDAGIGLDDGVNGAYLPGPRDDVVRDGQLKHGNVHTAAYYREVTMRLLMSDDVAATLREIHAELLSSKDGLGTKSRESFAAWAETHRDELRSRLVDDDDIDELLERAPRR